MSFASRYQYEPNHLWEWGRRETPINPWRSMAEIDIQEDFRPEQVRGVDLGYGGDINAWVRCISRIDNDDEDEYYDAFNHKWIELTKKEPEIDFNSPEWTELKL